MDGRGIFAVTMCRILMLEGVPSLASELWGILGSLGKELGWRLEVLGSITLLTIREVF